MTQDIDKITQVETPSNYIYTTYPTHISTIFINVGQDASIIFNITGRTCLPNFRPSRRLGHVLLNTKCLYTVQQNS
jgi:hypothetical protein